MREIILRKCRQLNFSLAQTVYARKFQFADEFKYLASETGHKISKTAGILREKTASRGRKNPAAQLCGGAELLREGRRSVRPGGPGAARASRGTPVKRERVGTEHPPSVSIYKHL